jgi:hypothetical protein
MAGPRKGCRQRDTSPSSTMRQCGDAISSKRLASARAQGDGGCVRAFCAAAFFRSACLRWVKSGRDALKFRCPLYPRKRTFATRSGCLLWANSGHRYWISSSAMLIMVGERVRPSDFADFKLTINSKRVGCSAGRSAGFAPFKILST